MRKLKGENGFTLVEVVTVMAIMIITMGILAYGISSFSSRTADEKLQELNISSKQAITLYYNLYGDYPIVANVVYPGVSDTKTYTKAETESLLTLLDNYTDSKLMKYYTKSNYEMVVNYPNSLIMDITFRIGT